VELISRANSGICSLFIESRAPGGDEPQSRPGLRLEP